MSELNEKLIDYGGLEHFRDLLLNDSDTTSTSTWSSEKINSMLAALEARIAALEPQPTPPGPPSDEIWYTSENNVVINPKEDAEGLSELPKILSNTNVDGKGVIKFAEPLTSIGDYVFNVGDVTSINIPYTVTTLGEEALHCFYNPNDGISKTDVTLNSSTPPTRTTDWATPFGSPDGEYSFLTIHVPAEAYDTYYNSTDAMWEQYHNYIVNPNEGE